MRIKLAYLFLFFSIFLSCCKKEPAADDPKNNGPFTVTTRLPLPDDIPYQPLGKGKILFERNYDQGGSSFYIIDIDNRKSKGFTLKSKIIQPDISPAGTKITFSLLNSDDLNSAWNIYVMNIDGSDCFRAFESDLDTYYPKWNKDGSKIIFYTSSPDGKVYMQSPVENSTDRVELIKFRYGDDPEWAIDPFGGISVSTAGNLATVSTSEKLNGLIGIEPYIGKAGVHVLLSPTTDLDFVSPNFSVGTPVYSPDGSKIAFISIYKNPEEYGYLSFSIHAMNTDGTNLTSFFGMGVYAPGMDLSRYLTLCWSPDGRKILFSAPDTGSSCHLYLIYLDGSSYYKVTNQENALDYNVSWSK